MKYNQKIFYKNDININTSVQETDQYFALKKNRSYTIKFATISGGQNPRNLYCIGVESKKTTLLYEGNFNPNSDVEISFFNNMHEELVRFYYLDDKYGKMYIFTGNLYNIEEKSVLLLEEQFASRIIITVHEYYNTNNVSNSIFYSSIDNIKNNKSMIAYKTRDRYYEFKSPEEISTKLIQLHTTPHLEVDSDYIMIEYYTEE